MARVLWYGSGLVLKKVFIDKRIRFIFWKHDEPRPPRPPTQLGPRHASVTVPHIMPEETIRNLWPGACFSARPTSALCLSTQPSLPLRLTFAVCVFSYTVLSA